MRVTDTGLVATRGNVKRGDTGNVCVNIEMYAMTPEENYLFDPQGYLVLCDALPESIVNPLNHAVDYLATLNDETARERHVERQYQKNNRFAKAGFPGQQPWTTTRARSWDTVESLKS